MCGHKLNLISVLLRSSKIKVNPITASVVEEILGDASLHFTLQSHLECAREKYPNFKGLICVLREVADLIKADEAEDEKEVKKQALHVAVTALRLYEGE